jgi:hypothetical protein
MVDQQIGEKMLQQEAFHTLSPNPSICILLKPKARNDMWQSICQDETKTLHSSFLFQAKNAFDVAMQEFGGRHFPRQNVRKMIHCNAGPFVQLH